MNGSLKVIRGEKRDSGGTGDQDPSAAIPPSPGLPASSQCGFPLQNHGSVDSGLRDREPSCLPWTPCPTQGDLAATVLQGWCHPAATRALPTCQS